MNKFLFTFLIFYMLILQLNADDDALPKVKPLNLNLTKLVSGEELYFEFRSINYIPSVPVIIKGYINPNNMANNWLVVLSSTSLNQPICFYLEGFFYFLDLKTGKFSSYKDCKFSLKVKKDLMPIPDLEIKPIRDAKSTLIEFQFLYFKELGADKSYKNKKDYSIILQSNNEVATYLFDIKDYNSIKALDVKICDFSVFSFNEFDNKKDINKINKSKEIFDFIKLYLVHLNKEKLIKKNEVSAEEELLFLDKIQLLQSFIATYEDVYPTQKLPKLLYNKRPKLEGIILEDYLPNFNIISLDFLIFLQDEKLYKKWYDALYDF